MKRIILKCLASVGCVLVALIVAVFGNFYLRKPVKARPASLKVEMTEARIARGKYIFNLADCDGCHSERDFSRFGGPVAAGGRGKGNVFPPELGLPGLVAPRNITPDPETGIGLWTDGEKIRAIREGISRDGRPLFPMMPYEGFRHMSDEDAYSLVAYLNTLKPVKNRLPKTKLDFPVSMFIRNAPHPAGTVRPPDRSNSVKYGEYLVTIAGCMGCHTPSQKGQPVAGMRLSGGEEFRFPFAVVVSANITPDPQTGIGRWTRQDFLDRFYQYKEYAEQGSPVVGPEGFTLMPWLNFCKLPEEDLSAIYTFLRTQRPVYHVVDTHPVGLASLEHGRPRS